jgi:regulator of sirC expression with transglutaminase-like and TPR domain
MVRYAPTTNEAADAIIDVFGGGQVLSRDAAQERVIETTGEGFRDSDYRAATKREIIVRILRNLIGVAERSDANADPSRYLDLILALVPDSVGDRLSRARLRLQIGDAPGAKADFKWLLDHQPAGIDLDRIAELYRSL